MPCVFYFALGLSLALRKRANARQKPALALLLRVTRVFWRFAKRERKHFSCFYYVEVCLFVIFKGEAPNIPPPFASGNFASSPSLAEGVRGWVFLA
ncbi:hypothetical protein [Helicobacter macacae]|uniref:hypothetical protein n=1 Tax=Helicobacter macacae TaxID=398626 RepID=UPI0011DDF179|nr:hypothetical protein [Helicobacter macacae]